MNPDHLSLWERIESFEFDIPGTRLTFAQRLARENGWGAAFTRRALLEYKRFVFLAMTAGHAVCPSDAVDQVWHMHLTYTRNYWDDFCGKTLGRPLHHGPTKGGREEDEKHRDMYAATLKAYRDAFREEPPGEIWHPGDVRFGDDVAFTRVNTRRNWVIPKPRWLRKAALLGVVTLALSAAGCFRPMPTGSIMDMKGEDFLLFFMLFSVGVFLVASVVRSRSRGKQTVPAADDLSEDVYAIATLNGGAIAAVNTAMLELARRQFIEVQPDGRPVTLPADEESLQCLHPFERKVYDSVSWTDSDMKEIRARLRGWVDGIVEHLRTRGLVMSELDIARSQSRVIQVLMLIPLMGVVKMFIGISRDKPVGYLVGLLLVAAIAIVIYVKKRPFRTKRGDAVVAILQRQQPMPGVQQRSELTAPAFGAGSFAMLAALYGTSVIAGTPLNHMSQAITPRGGDSSGAGCGGGCGTSSGGGGSGCSGGDGGGSSGCGGCGGGGGD